MNEYASSRPISFGINRFLGPRILEAWIRIRFDNEVADRCLSGISKRDRLGSRDRARLSEAIFIALRRRGSVDQIIGIESSGERENASQWLATALEQTWPDGPEPLPFTESEKPEESGNLPPAVVEALASSSMDLLALGLGLRQRAPVTLRCHGVPRSELMQSLAAAEVVTEATPYSPYGLTCADGAKLHQLPPALRAQFEIQDEGSQLLALMVGAQPGERVLDACAGAGGKTLAMLDSGAQLEASDIDQKRLRRLHKRLGEDHERVKITPIEASGSLPFGDPFDRILIDAPCTGTGTARRAPDLLWRLSAAELKRYTTIQAQILDRFAPLVRSGGVLIYATCSILPQENRHQVQAFLDRNSDFELLPVAHTLGGDRAEQLSANEDLTLLPHLHGTDGFYGAIMRRR